MKHEEKLSLNISIHFYESLKDVTSKARGLLFNIVSMGSFDWQSNSLSRFTVAALPNKLNLAPAQSYLSTAAEKNKLKK